MTGKTYWRYQWSISTYLSSLYEEIVFRATILFGLIKVMSPIWYIAISSILFGLWHIKNYKWQTRSQTVCQAVYTELVFGPAVSIITLWTRSLDRRYYPLYTQYNGIVVYEISSEVLLIQIIQISHKISNRFVFYTNLQFCCVIGNLDEEWNASSLGSKNNRALHPACGDYVLYYVGTPS